MTPQSERDQQDTVVIGRLSIAAAIYSQAMAMAVFLLMPVYLGAMAASGTLSESQLGVLTSADLMGIALASMSAVVWVKRTPWRLVVFVSLMMLIGINLASGIIDAFIPLLLLRFVSGIAAGCIAAVAVAVFSYARSPDRVVAIAVMFQVSFQALSFAVLPERISAEGVTGFFQYVIAFQLVALLAAVFLPANALAIAPAEDQPGRIAGVGNRLPLMALGAMLCFFITQTGVWAFIEVILNDAGFDDQRVSSALIVSTFVCLAGPLFVSVVGERFGRFVPVLVAGVMQLLILALLSQAWPFWGLVVLLSLFQLFWTLPVGYQYGALVAVDSSHRFVALVPAAQSLGIGLGPLLGGYALEFGGAGGLYLICAVALIVYLVLILPVVHKRGEQPLQISEQALY